ncbi:hypothetical protein CRYUN_Cryun32bG0034500 [Craigia yunnanensis]
MDTISQINPPDLNISFLRLKLTAEDLKEISDVVPIKEVAGDRNYDSKRKASWKFANMPPKDLGSHLKTLCGCGCREKANA